LNTPASGNDYVLFSALPVGSAISPRVDRRTFLIYHAAIGAAAVMTGSTWTPDARAQQAKKEAQQPNPAATTPWAWHTIRLDSNRCSTASVSRWS
jgi:L-serine dehydratase